jgi:hypothetical protein
LLDNFDVAVLTKVNELASRYTLLPYQFSASAGYQHGDYCVTFDMPDPGFEHQFDRMLSALGINPNASVAELIGTEREVWTRIATAIQKAPTSRWR